MIPPFLIIKSESQNEFDEIANYLMNSYGVKNDYSLFRLSEIEVYWNSPTHNDNSTYNRKHVDPNSGEWFFHYSGVDIALKSDKLQGHGGILIRRVYCLAEKKTYKGPLVCAMKLFSGNNAFKKSEMPMLIEYPFKHETISKSPRIGLGKNAKEGNTDTLEYRYTIDLK